MVWLLTGVLAAAGSAAWASGFAVAEAELGATAEADPVLASAASTSAAPQWVSEGPAPLTIGFQGQWARVDDDALLFEVDLSGADPSHRFQAGVYSIEDLDASGWTDLQLQFVLVEGACDGADLSNPDEAEVLNLLTTSDAAWTTQLDGGTVACVGVPGAGRADDTDGTFARRANPGVDPTMPRFTMSANRIE